MRSDAVPILSSKVGCYPGPKGSFADNLTRKLFDTEPEYLDTIPDAFFSVEHGKLDYCIVPSETKMRILTIVDRMFLETKDVFASKKVYVPVEFSLAGFNTAKDIETVYSKEEAFEQSLEYLHSKIPQAKKVRTKSTSEMLKNIGHKEAVICSSSAAERYGIPLIEKNIALGMTSFLVLSKKDSEYEQNNKYSSFLIYGIDGVVKYSSLENSLGKIFSKNRINLSSIISIPIDGEYAFSVWIDGHKNEKNISSALKEAEKITKFLRFCGSCEVERNLYKF